MVAEPKAKVITYMEENRDNRDYIKQIVVDYGLRKQIMAALGVTYPTVRSALIFKSDTRKAQQIRQYALDHGGMLLQSNGQFTMNNE